MIAKALAAIVLLGATSVAAQAPTDQAPIDPAPPISVKAPEATKAPDLMAALEQSIAAVKQKKAPAKKRKAPAKKAKAKSAK